MGHHRSAAVILTRASVIQGLRRRNRPGVVNQEYSPASQPTLESTPMASEEDKQELKDKVSSLIDERFGGDWDAAYRRYAQSSGAGSLIDRRDLRKLLKKAGVGNGLTRGAWVDGIIAELDTSGDGTISQSEFRTAMNRT